MKTLALLVGASGRLGRELARALRTDGLEVRALLRNSTTLAQRAALEQSGCQVVIGDLKDERSLSGACKGVDVVLSTATAIGSAQPEDTIETVDERGHLSLIAKAEAAAVAHIVYLSFPPIDLTFQLQTAKRRVEARLSEGRTSFTILQPSYFFEVWFSGRLGFSPKTGSARLFGTGTRPVSWVSLHDVARVATAAVCRPEAFGSRVLRLAGHPLSQLQILEEFERLGSARFTPDADSETTLKSRFDEARDGISQARAAMVLTLARGWVTPAEHATPSLLGTLRTARDFATEFLRNPS